MRLGVLLVILLGTLAVAIPFCNVTETSLLGCFAALLDPEGVGNVTLPQLEDRLTHLNYTYGATATGIFNRCDVNEDGVLSLDDWYNPNRTACLSDYNSRLITCFACGANGYTQVLTRYEEKKKK